MHMIERNQIVRRQTRFISPGLSNRNSCVVEIVNQIMRDSIICRLPDPNPNRTGKHLPAVVNAAVSNFVVTALLSLVLANRRFTYLDPARANIGKFTSDDSVAHTTSRQLQTVISQ